MAENNGGPEQQTEPTDIDKLRSEYDTKLSDASKANDDLKRQLDGLRSQIEAGSQQNTTLQAVEQALAAVDETGDNAVASLKVITRALGQELAGSRIKGAHVEGLYKQALANYHAATIAAEHGGDPKVYAAELMERSTTDSAMAENAKILGDKVSIEKAKKGSSGGGSGNGGNYRVDEGRGSPVRTDVLNEMNAIDILTPEGRAEFEKRSREFRQKIDAVSR